MKISTPEAFRLHAGLAWTAILLVAAGANAPRAAAQISLSQALDATNLVWTSGGNALWLGQTQVSHDGVDAARSGTIFDGQESWLQTTVAGPGTVTFWWKVSSEGDYDLLEFYIGAPRQSQISGEQDWRQVAFTVPSGTQTLRWRYSKDIGSNLGQDRGWVDEARFVPNTGAPVILVQPASPTVITGVTARLQVSAAGRQPLSYQWFRDETNPVAGATSATLTLANIQLTNAGQYRVVVTNLDGSVSSSNALLTVTTLGEVNNILLLADHTRLSPYESALTNQGRPYRRFNLASELAFNLAVETADPGRSLVIVDTAEWGHSLGYVENFARAGGRVILQYPLLGLVPGSTAPATFGVSVAQSLGFPPPLYNWGGSTFFTGLTSPINFQDFYLTDGQTLQPTAGARAVAGYVSAQTFNEAAVVIGNSNRTIVNGFILATATSAATASRFAQNEIEYLIGPPVPMPPVISLEPEDLTAVEGAAPTFVAQASGPPPLRYQWYFNQTNALLNGTNATLVLTNVQMANAGQYQLVVTNLVGAATSRVASLTVTTPGPIETVLLFNDYTGTIYETALGNVGLAYQRFNADSHSPFSAAIRSADPATTLVVVDAVDRIFDFSAVERFARSGGRVVLEYLNLQAGSLASALNLASVQPFNPPSPVYDWGGSQFLAGVPSPLTVFDLFIISGQRFQPAAGGQAVAGFTSIISPSQAAVVIGNFGRTIVNGFALEEVISISAAIRFAQNQLVHLIGLTTPVPFIVGQPEDQTVVQGASASFSVSVGGSQPLHYQWYFNQTNALANATNATLTLSNVQIADAGQYHLVVANLSGAATSRVATLTVTTLEPVATVLLFNDYSATIYESALSSLGLSYLRYSDDTAFNAAIRNASLGTTLVVVDAVAAPGRNLSAVEQFVRSGGRALLQYLDMQAGSLSEAFGLATVQPFEFPSPVYDWGGSSLFEGVATPLTMADFFIRSGQRYQPAAGAQAVAGFTSIVSPSQAAVVIGNFGRTIVNGFALEEVTVVNNAIRLAQNELQLLVANVLTIIGQPTSQNVRLGGNVTNAVRALSPAGPITYQWRFNGTNLPGATNSSLVITNVQLAHEGTYSVIVADSLSSLTSSNATLTVLVRAAITLQPISQTAVQGGSATFTVEAGGTLPLSFRWRRAGVTFTNGIVLSTPTNSSLTLTNVQLSDATNYTVAMTNLAGTAPVSSNAFLIVLLDTDRDGIPDALEPLDGLADSDGDGLSDAAEYFAGTDHLDSNSVLRLEIARGSASLWFNAQPGKSYSVQSTDSLFPTQWRKLADVLARTNSRVETLIDPAPATNRYYRLVTPIQR